MKRKKVVDNAQNKDAPEEVIDLINKLPEKTCTSPTEITKEIAKKNT